MKQELRNVTAAGAVKENLNILTTGAEALVGRTIGGLKGTAAMSLSAKYSDTNIGKALSSNMGDTYREVRDYTTDCIADAVNEINLDDWLTSDDEKKKPTVKAK